MKTGCFLSPFIDTVDAKVCIFNQQSISQAGIRPGTPYDTRTITEHRRAENSRKHHSAPYSASAVFIRRESTIARLTAEPEFRVSRTLAANAHRRGVQPLQQGELIRIQWRFDQQLHLRPTHQPSNTGLRIGWSARLPGSHES